MSTPNNTQSLELLKKYIALSPSVATDAQIKGLFDYVKQQPVADELFRMLSGGLLKTLSDPTLNFASSTGTGGFSQSTSARTAGIGIFVFAHLYNYVNNIPGVSGCTVNAGGFSTVVIPVTGGTLFYNDKKDLTGTCNASIGAVGPYFGITYWTTDKGAFAQYVAGGVPSIGVLPGAGQWD